MNHTRGIWRTRPGIPVPGLHQPRNGCGHMAIRRTVYFTGTVQGVGFRFTTRRLAAGYSVTGWVRNLPDGRVELVAEGSPEEVDGFVAAVRREMEPCITDVSVAEARAAGTFDDFSIAY